jgi:hypothetical protein
LSGQDAIGSDQDAKSASRIIANFVIGIPRRTHQSEYLLMRLTGIAHCIAGNPPLFGV